MGEDCRLGPAAGAAGDLDERRIARLRCGKGRLGGVRPQEFSEMRERDRGRGELLLQPLDRVQHEVLDTGTGQGREHVREEDVEGDQDARPHGPQRLCQFLALGHDADVDDRRAVGVRRRDGHGIDRRGRQHQGDAVAAAQPEGAQRVRHAVGARGQFAVRRVGAVVAQRHPVRVRGGRAREQAIEGGFLKDERLGYWLVVVPHPGSVHRGMIPPSPSQGKGADKHRVAAPGR